MSANRRTNDRTSKRSGLLSWLWVLCLVACACTATTMNAQSAVLFVETVPEDAIVFIDGSPVAPIDRVGGRIRLVEGSHRVEIQAEGYVTHREDVAVVAGAEYIIEVELWPLIDEIDE